MLSPPGGRGAESKPACVELEPGPSRTVTRIIDGETLTLDDGSELRLVGVLAPRAIDVGAVPGTWRLELAAVEALQTLVLGRTIEVRYAGQRADRYGRVKGHAFLLAEADTVWVQGRLLETGLARAYTLAAHRECEADLLAAERTAREARLGIWSEAAYQVRSADDGAALLRHAATFQVIEGRVARVGVTRGSVYLDFDKSRRSGFSASLRLADRPLLGSFQDNPRWLEGAQVRVRGWVEERGGRPRMDLSTAGSVEVLDGGHAAGRVEQGSPAK